MIGKIASALLKAPIHVYRWTLKPLAGHHCRHWPTCSAYALEAIDTNGAWRGFWLTLSRLVRCGPGGTSGVDAVPDIQSEHHPFAPWRYGRWRARSGQSPANPSPAPVQVIKTITSGDGRQRVELLRNPSGTYSFAEYELVTGQLDYIGRPAEPYWHPVSGDTHAVCDSAETAEREAFGRLAWLREER